MRRGDEEGELRPRSRSAHKRQLKPKGGGLEGNAPPLPQSLQRE